MGYSRLFWGFFVDNEVTITSWDTFSSFYEWLSDVDIARIKRYIKKNNIDTTRLEVGSYRFNDNYTPRSFVSHILSGSEKNFSRVTILEGWSIYDIDEYLYKEFWVDQWAYIRYVTDISRIDNLKSSYAFLQQAGAIVSLEWFLYPETYFVDSDADVVSALVKVQLDTFDSRVWDIIQEDLQSFYRRLSLEHPRVSLDRYDLVTLASVVQKEERIVANQPTIAWIFLNRLQIGMRLDADITLCYGLKQPYSVCTPWYIARYVSDDTNIFNTRRKWWLPPQAIANIPLSAIQSLLSYENTDYLYYLHDMSGRIYYGTTLDQHNSNKQQYLR